MNNTRKQPLKIPGYIQDSPSEVACFFQSIPQDCTARSTEKCHRHDDYEIYFLQDGEANFYLEHQGFHLLKGCCVFLRPNVFHRLEYLSDTPCHKMELHVSAPYLHCLNTLQTDLSRALNQSNRPYTIFHFTAKQADFLAALGNHLEKALHCTCFGDDILSECLLKEILLFLNTLPQESFSIPVAHAPVPELVTRITEYVLEHLTDDLSIDFLGQVFQYNGHYISRRFRESLGISLRDYIIEKRIDLARKHLAAGCSLTNACCQSGFHDYCNFTKAFSRHVGISPKQYQLENQRPRLSYPFRNPFG